jgi:hypothetical protein
MVWESIILGEKEFEEKLKEKMKKREIKMAHKMKEAAKLSFLDEEEDAAIVKKKGRQSVLFI